MMPNMEENEGTVLQSKDACVDKFVILAEIIDIRPEDERTTSVSVIWGIRENTAIHDGPTQCLEFTNKANEEPTKHGNAPNAKNSIVEGREPLQLQGWESFPIFVLPVGHEGLD